MTKNEFALTTRDVVLIGIALAIIETAKFALGFMPGVEIVSLLFIIYTLFFQKKMVYVLPAFCLLEGVMYGFGIWWFIYLYIWAVLVSVAYLFRKKNISMVLECIIGHIRVALWAAVLPCVFCCRRYGYGYIVVDCRNSYRHSSWHI